MAEIVLDEAGYDPTKVEKEWKQVRSFITCHYLKPERPLAAAMIWQNILRYRRNEYPNVCKLVSLVIDMSGSNSTVERAFSMLTLMLSYLQLSLRQKVINDIMVIKGKDNVSSPEEKALLMERALDIYWSKRKVTKVLDVEPPQKAMHFDEAICEAEDSSSDTDSDTSSSSDEDLHI